MTEGLYKGDCLDMMRAMEPESVDAIVTDPPYGLAFMGKDWDHGVPGEEYWPIIAARVAHAERTRQPELFGGEVC